MANFLSKLFGSPTERALSKYRQVVDKINAFEPGLKALSDDALRAKTDGFKARLEKGEPIDDLVELGLDSRGSGGGHGPHYGDGPERGEDGDDRDYDQQLGEREAAAEVVFEGWRHEGLHSGQWSVASGP